MKRLLILSTILLAFLLAFNACDSVTSPDLATGVEGDYKEATLHPPSLTSPEDKAPNISSNVLLAWEEVTGSADYRVQVTMKEDFSSPIIDSTLSNTSFKLEGLSNDSTFFWRVNAHKDAPENLWSEVRSFTTDPAAQAPTQPVLTTPGKGSGNQETTVSLSWQGVPEANSYQIHVSDTEDFSSIIVDQEETAATSEISSLSNAKEYYWRVRSINDSGVSPWSESWDFVTKEAVTTPPSTPSSDMWVSAYLASYNHYAPPGGNWGNLPTEEIDWDAFTHLFYFSLKAKADGTLSTIKEYENMNPDRINSIVRAAHDEGKPVIFTVGGWGNHDGFKNAITPAVRPIFISSIVSVLKTWGFDGVDIDMEPIESSDSENYKAFIRELHTALDGLTTPIGSKPLLTAATAWRPDVFSDLQQYFDQINLMTYDFSGAWPEWVSWHNSPVYDGSMKFANGKPVPSIEGKINQFIEAGVPKEKLGIGIDFYGYVWNGYVTDPGQSWTTAPQVQDNVPYHEIMDTYYNSDSYRWDEKAEAAYLRLDHTDPAKKKFISYDDEESIKSKIDYTRQKGIGGVIIWELSGGYFKDKPAGQRDPLLQAVKESVWK